MTPESLKQARERAEACGEHSQLVFYPEYFISILDHVDALEKKLEKAREALRWYADRNNWSFNSYTSDCKEVVAFSDLGCKSFNGENDFTDYAASAGGRRARETLEKMVNE
jgi:hypothetical protein